MRDKIIDLIKVLGFGCNEIVVDILIDDNLFNTIEWQREEDRIILHMFIEDLDFSLDFDYLEESKQKEIYNILCICYN